MSTTSTSPLSMPGISPSRNGSRSGGRGGPGGGGGHGGGPGGCGAGGGPGEHSCPGGGPGGRFGSGRACVGIARRALGYNGYTSFGPPSRPPCCFSAPPAICEMRAMRIARQAFPPLRPQIGLERRKQCLLRPVLLIRLPDELQDAAHEGVVAGRRTG